MSSNFPTWCMLVGPPIIPPKLQERQCSKSQSFSDRTNSRPVISRTIKGIEVHCFPRRKWVALKRTGCVVWQNKWKQCYRECLKWPPYAWTHDPSRFRHWSMASSTMICCSPAHVSTSRLWKMTFWHSPGTVATVCGWGGQTYNLLMSSSFRIQCAKND